MEIKFPVHDAPACKDRNLRLRSLLASLNLTDEDSERLKQIATNRIFRIGRRAANGRTDEDLLHEALVRTLNGSRQWYSENLEFVPYLVGVIWSIASEWAGHHKRKANSPEYAVLEAQISMQLVGSLPIRLAQLP